MENRQWFLKNFKIHLQYDPAFPLLGMHAKELMSGPQIDICILMVMAALFITAKR